MPSSAAVIFHAGDLVSNDGRTKDDAQLILSDWITAESNHVPLRIKQPVNLTLYKVLNRLGLGAFGAVFRGECLRWDSSKAKVFSTPVALKIIDLEDPSDIGSTNNDQMETVRREMAVLQRVQHPNITRYHLLARIQSRWCSSLWVPSVALHITLGTSNLSSLTTILWL
jgi:serine/threonine protein kinase